MRTSTLSSHLRSEPLRSRLATTTQGLATDKERACRNGMSFSSGPFADLGFRQIRPTTSSERRTTGVRRFRCSACRSTCRSLRHPHPSFACRQQGSRARAVRREVQRREMCVSSGGTYDIVCLVPLVGSDTTLTCKMTRPDVGTAERGRDESRLARPTLRGRHQPRPLDARDDCSADLPRERAGP